jgi:beta-galactosidase
MKKFFAQDWLLVIVGVSFVWPVPARATLHRASGAMPSSSRRIMSLDDGWQLYSMPQFNAWPAEAQLTNEQIAQLKMPAPGQGWQPVRLPDDYVVRGSITQEPNAAMLAGGAVCPLGGRECGLLGAEPPQGQPHALNRAGRDAYAGHGYLPVYPAWYVRSAYVDSADRDKEVWLEFAGIYRDAIVFVNGKFIAQHASGYTGFRLNITSAIRFGAKNNISVFVDPRWFEGWWYEGGGIYRHARLIVTSKLYVSPWGTFVDARVPGSIRHGSADGDHAAAQLEIQTTVRNSDTVARHFTLLSQVMDGKGKVAASSSTEEDLTPGEESTFKQPIALPDALLWSLQHRHLYQLVTTLLAGRATADNTATSFGVRSLRFDPEHGFFLNDQHVEIRGMCVHQDFPGVGIAAPDNLWRWRIEKLQAMGTNAYRTAHSPVSDAFYDDADTMGMLVMAETRHLGDTYFPKASSDTTAVELDDIRSMVRQLRNHPSIIMWSFCNEEGEGKTPHGAKLFAAMKQAVEELDPSRPVTGAINGGYTAEGYIPVESILGMNYHNDEFAKLHAAFPRMMIYGSEDVNAKTSRGTITTSRPNGRCSEYGCDATLDTGPWRSWVPVAENPYVAGEFVWTGFDYRGEPNPFSWPAVTSQTGAMDLAGFPKPVYYYWKAAWQPEPLVYISPEWDRPQNEIGKEITVRAFSNCDHLELLLNGKSLGVKAMPKNQYVDWKVLYAPGTLAAQGYMDGHVSARYTLRTPGAPAALRLTVDMRSLKGNGEDVAPIEVAVLDAEGDLVSNADNDIEFSVSGVGSLAGVANGDPASHESNVGPHRMAFHGLAMVLARAGDHPGTITVKARTKGLPAATITLDTIAERSSHTIR